MELDLAHCRDENRVYTYMHELRCDSASKGGHACVRFKVQWLGSVLTN